MSYVKLFSLCIVFRPPQSRPSMTKSSPAKVSSVKYQICKVKDRFNYKVISCRGARYHSEDYQVQYRMGSVGCYFMCLFKISKVERDPDRRYVSLSKAYALGHVSVCAPLITLPAAVNAERHYATFLKRPSVVTCRLATVAGAGWYLLKQ
ncbi:hypothetical protein BCR43DRAFT_503084 [Syncephalastrum racemosum]|uniref:Uncharacterized protein n=1 Tax=Syncephalastrum racemosum TaxID=13706 RepID=A0A1X2HQ88_SYNRA|nr:hypothetical protein BCR43DRAFT_503084 [Syncephalastrum racemosum]